MLQKMSVDRRVIPPKDMEEEQKPPPSCSTHCLDQHEINRSISEVREDLEHERYRRYAPILCNPGKYREADRAKDRAGRAFAQIQIERDVRSLIEDLASARGKSLN